MRDDDQSLLSKIISKASDLGWNKTVREQVNCPDCGEWIARGDHTSICGSHPELSAPGENDFLVRIGFIKPRPREKELPPPVERLDGQQAKRIRPNVKQRDERYVNTAKADPITEAPMRTDGGKSRRDYVGLRGGNDPFIAAQEANLYSYEPDPNDERTDIEKHRGRDELPYYRLGD